MDAPGVVKPWRITLNGRSLALPDCEVAHNYADVSAMFYHAAALGVSSGASIIDVGANIGVFSLCYAALFTRSTVYAFEPHPDNYTLLLQGLALNPELADRIRPVKLGLSNAAGVRSLSMPLPAQHARYGPGARPLNCGLFSLHGERTERIPCELATLDAFCTAKGIERVGFIKVDVEGHEYEVLEGATGVIRASRPILFVEYNELTRTLSPHGPAEFEVFFRRHRYQLFGLRYGWAKELAPLSRLEPIEQISDLVCIPEP